MKGYKIRHQIPGRVRLSIACAERDALSFALLEKNLSSLACVSSMRTNLACNSLAVNYIYKQDYRATLSQILDNVELSIQQLIAENKVNISKISESLQVSHISSSSNSLSSSKSSNFAKKKSFFQKRGLKEKRRVIKLEQFMQAQEEDCDCKNAKEHKDLVRPALLRFSSLSAIFGLVLARRIIFSVPIAQGFLSPLGLASVLFSLPLLKSGFEQAKKKKVSLDAFLGTGCVVTAFSSQALAAFEILWINAGAELLTAYVTERSRKSISSILQVTSHHTFTLVDGIEIETKVTDLKEGDVVVLHTGEKVCVDGEIIDGHALLDEAPISGRPDLVQKSIGDSVLAGTFVNQGLIYVCAKQVGDQTYLSRVLCLVEDEIKNKAPLEAMADKLAKKLIFLGFIATGGTFLLTQSISRAFTVLLVMACPCATALSASTAINASINVASKKNILIKGGRYLEEVSKIDCVCFDKTGTLTVSEPKLAKIIPLDNLKKISAATEKKNEDSLLQLAVSTEMHNHHPIAQAIKQEAQLRGISLIAHTCCEYFLGMGMSATLDNDEILVGNHKLLELQGINSEILSGARKKNLTELVEEMRLMGKTVLYVAKNREVIGLLTFDNPMRAEAQSIIQTLKDTGVKNIYLITGDEENTARTLSEELKLKGYYASVMPTQKAEIVKELQAKYNSVLMVGDGINDAVALAQANVGVAMGAGGSEVAVEAADITLVNDDLCGIIYLHQLSRETIKVVHQNFWIATSSNIAGVLLGAFGVINPVLAGTLHIAHTLGVLASSSRLLKYEAIEYLSPCGEKEYK